MTLLKLYPVKAIFVCARCAALKSLLSSPASTDVYRSETKLYISPIDKNILLRFSDREKYRAQCLVRLTSDSRKDYAQYSCKANFCAIRSFFVYNTYYDLHREITTFFYRKFKKILPYHFSVKAKRRGSMAHPALDYQCLYIGKVSTYKTVLFSYDVRDMICCLFVLYLICRYRHARRCSI